MAMHGGMRRVVVLVCSSACVFVCCVVLHAVVAVCQDIIRLCCAVLTTATVSCNSQLPPDSNKQTPHNDTCNPS